MLFEKLLGKMASTNFTVVPPKEPVGSRPGLDVCLVIDTSGSMGQPANPNSTEGINLFTKMDLAKRGAEVVARALGENDNLTIFEFNDDVNKVLHRTTMNSYGLVKALEALDTLQPDGCTALWNGLYAGLYEMEVNNMDKDKDRIPVVILLTDGMPSASPPDGEVGALRTYLGKDRARAAKLVTIGFGYDVNSKLLADLANASVYDKRYSVTYTYNTGNDFLFIPDGTMLLTNFVNMLANIQSICERNVVLRLTLKDGTTKYMPIGDVLYGQERHVVLEDAIIASIDTATLVGDLKVAVAADPVVVTRELHRKMAIDAIEQALKIAPVDLSGAQELIKNCAKKMMAVNGIEPIVEDLRGEVTSALGTKDAFDRWGCHYLPSLVLSHRNQTCANFKDPGLQAYGGAFTKGKRDDLNAMCDGLPVPKPSLKPVVQTSSYGGHGTYAQPITVAAFRNAFNNANGGCVAAGTKIAVPGGGYKPIEDLKKGDLVSVPESPNPAKVVCVVACKNVGTVKLGELDITPWHPVKTTDGQWAFPAHLVTDKTPTHQPIVYTLVLDSGHVVLANGIPIVTLGHGFKEDVVEHPFYGTNKVIEALKALNVTAFENGRIELGNHGIPEVDGDGNMIGFTKPE